MIITNLTNAGYPLEDGDMARFEYTDGTIVEQQFWSEEHKAQSEPLPTIRIITKRAFMRRFTQAERIAVRQSADDIVIDIHEDLKMSSFVDLDSPDVSTALDYLVAINILSDAQRKVGMLVDGTSDESL